MAVRQSVTGALTGPCVVLASFFGESTQFKVTSDVMPGVVRQFDGYSAAHEEVKNARVFAGIHFRSATNNGEALGVSVGDYVLHHALRPVYAEN